MHLHHAFLILCICIHNVWANTEKIIFASDTTSCHSPPIKPFDTGQPLVHPYTALRTSLISPSTVLYPLHDLAPGSNYEVRLSYPATVPTDFEFALICQDDRLWGVLIQGVYAGVSRQAGIEKVPVPADIVLEELALGVVYHGIYKVAVMIIGALILGYFVIVPHIKGYLLQATKED
ncbi:hypothetical protein [Absidia glauca]|uniref:Uncharacterized protein n=1 Tax=Absidia glauca TaxID=4829 RepID=A0A168RRL1_ABSGL|nr:hypothetical protein [Absidia glauca]